MPRQTEKHQLIDSLFERHRDRLGRLGASQLCATARQFSDCGGGSVAKTGRCLAIWLCRLTLCLVAAVVAVSVLSQQLISGGYATQSTEWLAALTLAEQKLLRRVSHALRFYDTETAMSMGRCLVPSPFGGGPARGRAVCCGCEPMRVARLRVNITYAALLIDSLYSRSVSPFLLIPTPPVTPRLVVDFARLSAHVAEHRDAFRFGGNRIEALPHGGPHPLAPTDQLRFDDLFPQNRPSSSKDFANGRVLMWTFDHLSAVRALRRLVSRPEFFGQRTERLQRVSLLIAADGGGPSGSSGEGWSAGDFPEMRALAYATPLSGLWRIRLDAKPECCRSADAGADSATILEPGQAIFFPTDCYEMKVELMEAAGAVDGALVYIGFIYNGAHQAKIA